MVDPRDGYTGPFRRDVARWRHVGDAVGADGETVRKPWTLAKAEFVDSLCQRYGCLPSALRQESAYDILQIVGLLGDGGGTVTESSPESRWNLPGEALNE